MKLGSKITIFSIIASILGIVAPGAYAQFQRKALELSYPKIPGLPDITQDTQLPDLINYIFGLFVAISGIIAFAALVFAGFLFLTSGANPMLRLQARRRLTQVFTGLLLLLGIFIVLNTINPDLTRLTQPGIAPQIPSSPSVLQEPAPIFEADVFDGDKLSGGPRYGGAVFYEEDDTRFTNGKGKSETIFHNIPNFQNSTWMGNTPVSAIRVLGDCEVRVVLESGLPVTIANNKVAIGILTQPIKSVEFPVQGCLGNSVMLYNNENYNATVKNANEAVSMVLIDSVWNLGKRRPFSGAQLDFNDAASSLITTLATGNPADLKYHLCENKDFEQLCTPTLNSGDIADLRLAPGGNFHDNVSSLQFATDKYRQAGVVLFEGKNFSERNEILISSDADISSNESGNVISQRSTGPGPNLDSLIIIGKYRVTLYDTHDPILGFPTASGKSITINNAIDTPCITSINAVPPGPAGESRIIENQPLPPYLFKGNRLYIPDLDNPDLFCREYENNNPEGRCTETWGDTAVSVEIQILTETLLDQNIAPLNTMSQIRECGTGSDVPTPAGDPTERHRYHRI